MIPIDFTGKVALVTGVGDNESFAWFISKALNAAGAAASFVELSSPFGHDAFLLDTPELNRVIDGFLRAEAA